MRIVNLKDTNTIHGFVIGKQLVTFRILLSVNKIFSSHFRLKHVERKKALILLIYEKFRLGHCCTFIFLGTAFPHKRC